ncbi:unnamed protein product [Linum trigynum]|uniref:Uncharacterized protein n=1 Tax=Linum trigynum TaxID=586398 RepID=A0AAV2EN57_9ROSI
MMNIESELLELIIDRWDEGTKCINLGDGKKIFITKDDVYRVYGLPRGPNVVEFDLKASAKTTLGRKFVSTCSTKGNIVDDDLLLCLEKEADDERWVKLYILLVFCKLLGSVQSRVVTAEDLKFLEPHMIQYFNQFNWCQHVCDHVCDSLQKFKSSVDSLQKVKSSVDGDMHFLLVCYPYRITVGQDRCFVSTVVPTYKKIRDRKKAVGDQFGSSAFGKVFVLSDPPASSSSGPPLGSEVKETPRST